MDIALLLIGVICLHCHKPSWTFTIFLGLSTSYYQMGGNLSTVFVAHNVSDTGMLLLFYMLFYGIYNRQRYDLPIFSRHLFWLLFYFGLFLILVILYDYGRGSSIVSIVQCYRHWLLVFLSIPLVKMYPIEIFEDSIKKILYISVFATVLILADHYLGSHILHEDAGLFISKSGVYYERGAIPTTYSIFYIILLLTPYFKELNSKWKYIFIGLFFLSISASMIRSMIISVLIGIVWILHMTKIIRLNNLGTVLIGMILIAGVIFSDTGLRERMSLGFREMNSISSSSTIKERGNLTFRLELLKERANYVSNQWDRSLFGIGSIREKEFPTTFKTGLYNSQIGRPTQLDTSDISWALLVLRLGILGTFLLMVIWFKLILLSRQCTNFLGKSQYVYLCISFLLSFAGPNFAQGHYWLFMIVLLMISYHQEYDIVTSKEN